MTAPHRIGGWQRIGIVLSVMWLMIVSACAAYDYHHAIRGNDSVFVTWTYPTQQIEADARRQQDKQFAICLEKYPDKSSLDYIMCAIDVKLASKEAQQVLLEREFLWLRFFSSTGGLIVSLWVLIYLLAWAARWIARGFRLDRT